MVVDQINALASSDVTGLQSGGRRDIFIDGFVPPSTSGAPMFPFYENSSEWDDFGEIIIPDDYIIKEEDMDQDYMQVGGDGKFDENSANLIFDDSKPSKVVSEELTVQVKCSSVYMDFEGRSDGRLIKSILAHVAPLKLVLVHGSNEATDHLKEHCTKHVCPHVYVPKIGETIDVTSDLCAYKVQLSERLMSNVLLKKLGDYEIAWADAEIGKSFEDGMLSLLPLSTPPPPHKFVFVGDFKLADFKQFLSSKGIQVEFSGGALRCGECVTVRKIGDAGQKAVVYVVVEEDVPAINSSMATYFKPEFTEMPSSSTEFDDVTETETLSNKEDHISSKMVQVPSEVINSPLEGHNINENGLLETIPNSVFSDSYINESNTTTEIDGGTSYFEPLVPDSVSSAGIPAPSLVSAALQVPPGKVVVYGVVDQVQGQALAALQVLKVIEAYVQPGDLCTRREYARWLVSASSALSRNTMSKVYPAMYIENVTELAFDDITTEDPDFASMLPFKAWLKLDLSLASFQETTWFRLHWSQLGSL